MLAYAKKEIQAEIEKFKQRLESRLQDSMLAVPLRLALGKLYERAGDKIEAIQEFATVMVHYADQGQMIKALAVAQLIKRVDPENHELLERMEEMYFLRKSVSDTQMQDYQESLKHLDALQREQPEAAAPAKADAAEASASAPTAAENIDVLAALKQIPVFEKLSVSELRGTQTNSLLRQFAANEPLFTNGNVRRSLFAILQGSVKVFGKDQDHRDTFLAMMNAGSSFGEFGLFGRVDPNLSVIVDSAATILEIPREVVLKLAKARPHVAETLKDIYRRRMLDNALGRVPLFSQLTPQDRKKIVGHFKPVKAEKERTLVREGEPGESMYFIITGEVGVYTALAELTEDAAKAAEEELLLLATLKSGDFFGEQALITDEPRSATVIALTDVTMLEFSKRDLAAVIQEYPDIESALQIEAIQNTMRKKLALLKELMPG